MVELVGLELTTKVLWNMLGVRPTPLVGHPIPIVGCFVVLLDFAGFLILEQPPKCYGTWLVSDQLPWSDTHPDRGRLLFSVISWRLVVGKAVRVRPAHHVGHFMSVCLCQDYRACHFGFLWPENFHFLETEKPDCGDQEGRGRDVADSVGRNSCGKTPSRRLFSVFQ